MNKRQQIFEQIADTHNTYLSEMSDRIAALKLSNKTTQQKIDDLGFHVIEEIIELRRTYPHKFWKQSKEETDKPAMLEEAADIFLMFRSMYLEICKECDITEEQFLENVLNKAQKNQRRLHDGY